MYLDEHRKKYNRERERAKRENVDTYTLRPLLRSFNSESDAEDLSLYTAEYRYFRFPLGYVLENGRPRWFNLIIGAGDLGETLWKRVHDNGGDIDISGMAIGMLENTSYFVLVEPGGGVFLVYDFEDETGEDHGIPWTIVSIHDKIDNIGTAFDLNYGSDIDDYQVDDIELDELGSDYLPLRFALQDSMK
jgi:hypothetical protein